jgi:hypothetical protein
MRQLRVLDAVLCDFSKFVGISLKKSREYLLWGHIELLVLEKVLGNVVQRIRLEFVFALHVLKQIEHVSAFHRDHLELVVPESTRTEILFDQLDNLPMNSTPYRGQAAMNRRSNKKILEIETKYIPASNNVRISLQKILLKSLKKLTLCCKTLVPGSLFETQTLAVEIPRLSKLTSRHSNLKNNVSGIFGIRETSR